MNFLSPAMGERVIAKGVVKKSGKTLIVTSGEAIMIHQGQERHVATMLATMFPIRL